MAVATENGDGSDHRTLHWNACAGDDWNGFDAGFGFSHAFDGDTAVQGA
jgi:hypothetical protein